MGFSEAYGPFGQPVYSYNSPESLMAQDSEELEMSGTCPPNYWFDGSKCQKYEKEDPLYDKEVKGTYKFVDGGWERESSGWTKWLKFGGIMGAMGLVVFAAGGGFSK